MSKLYTTHEAATFLKIDLKTLQKRLKRDADKPPAQRHYPGAVKRGRDWLIPEQDIQPKT
jgi:hypothetical protein